MNTLKFKTNVNCSGCIATVTPHLNQIKGIGKWSVDTSTSQKVLTVESEGISPEEITSVLKNAGYQAEVIATE